MAVIKYDREKLLPEFLCEQLKTDTVQRQFTTGTKGVAIKHLHLGVIGETDIIIPPVEHQEEFADFVQQVNKSKAVVQAAHVIARNLYSRRKQKCRILNF